MKNPIMTGLEKDWYRTNSKRAISKWMALRCNSALIGNLVFKLYGLMVPDKFTRKIRLEMDNRSILI